MTPVRNDPAELLPPIERRDTVIILGAGASYGSELSVEGRPPLLKTFLRDALALPFAKEFTFLWKFLEDACSIDRESLSSGRLDFESLFSYLDARSRVVPIPYVQRVEEFRYFSPVDYLASFVATTINWYCKGLAERTCPLHDRLALFAESTGATIVSLNYDLIMDASLERRTGWSYGHGYGVDRSVGTYLLGIKNYVGPFLLKPHGSINWSWRDQNKGEVSVGSVSGYLKNSTPIVGCLAALPVARKGGGHLIAKNSRSPALVFPTAYKDLAMFGSDDSLLRTSINQVFTHLWLAVTQAKRIVIVGARLTHDLHVLATIADAISRNPNPTVPRVEVVDPTSEGAELNLWLSEVRKFLPRGVALDRRYPTLADFVQSLEG